MDEHILAVRALYESVALCGVKPFHNSFFSHYLFLLTLCGVPTAWRHREYAETNIRLSTSRSPCTRNAQLLKTGNSISNPPCVRKGKIWAKLNMGKELRNQLLAWWYFAIAAGFLLLGVNRLILGSVWWQIALRWAISIGFLLLGFGMLNSRKR